MSFLGKVLYVFFTQIANLIATVAINIIIARILGPSGRGVVSLVTLVPFLLFNITNFGLYLGNSYYAGRKKVSVQRIAANAVWFSLIISVITIVIVYFSYPLIAPVFFHNIPRSLILLGLVALPFIQLSTMLDLLLLLRNRVRTFSIMTVVRTAIYFVLLLLFVVVLHLGVRSVIAAWLIATITETIITTAIFYRHIPKQWRLDWKLLKQTLRFGLKGYVASALTLLNDRMDLLMVSHFLLLPQVGIYSIALAMIEFFRKFAQSVTSLIYPRVAAETNKAANDFTPRIFRNLLWLLVVVGIAAELLGGPVIGLLFGPQYSAAFEPFRIMLPTYVLWSAVSVLVNDLVGRGKLVANSIVSVIIFAVNVTATFTLTPRYGLSGAAIATTVTYTTASLIFFVIFLRETTVHARDLFMLKRSDLEYFFRLFVHHYRRVRKSTPEHIKKVLIFAPYGNPHVLHWVTALQAGGFTVSVISYRSDRFAYVKETAAKNCHELICELTQGTVLRRARQAIKNYRAVQKFIHQEKPDIIHIHGIVPNAILYALWNHGPIIVSPWGSDITEDMPGARPYQLFAFTIASRVTVTSDFLRRVYHKKFQREFPQHTIAVVPFGVDDAYFTVTRNHHQPPVIGFAKNLFPHYGALDLLAAVAKLHKKGIDFRLRIAGEGGQRKILEDFIAKEKLGDVVEFVGWVPPKKMPYFFATIDLFAMPSHRESFGVSALEAAAVGVPSVATHVGGIPEAVQHESTGILVARGDVVGLMHALERLLSNHDLRTSMGNAARKFVQESFSREQSLQKMSEVYQSLKIS